MILALDIGATNIRIALVFGKKVKNKIIVKTPKSKNDIEKAIFSLIESFIETEKTKYICIGIAAMQKNGVMICTPNMDFNNINLKKLIESKFKIKTYVDNDAKCAGLGERYYGAGKNHKNFILLTLGTGIGGAAFIDGKLYKGKGIGPEPGHMFLTNEQFEKIASGKAAINLAANYGLKITSGFELEELAKKGNKKAIEVYNKIGRNLGIGLLNLTYILDPEIIILGGGFSKVKIYWKEMLKTLYGNDLLKRNIPVVAAKLGDNAGLIGAALLPKIGKFI